MLYHSLSCIVPLRSCGFDHYVYYNSNNISEAFSGPFWPDIQNNTIFIIEEWQIYKVSYLQYPVNMHMYTYK